MIYWIKQLITAKIFWDNREALAYGFYIVGNVCYDATGQIVGYMTSYITRCKCLVCQTNIKKGKEPVH